MSKRATQVHICQTCAGLWEWIVPDGPSKVYLESSRFWKMPKGAKNNAINFFGVHFPDYELRFLE